MELSSRAARQELSSDIFDRIESAAMVDHERFSVPSEIEEILDRLPLQVTLHVPDQIKAYLHQPLLSAVMPAKACIQ
jgi:hypothetical protein